MFENIGSKIKGVAEVVCWIGIIASVFGGVLLFLSGDESIVLGILVIVFGLLGSWLGSLTMYGFGQLIENTDILVRNQKAQQPNIQNEKIKQLKELREKGLITLEEYEQKLKELKGECKLCKH